MVRGSLAVTYFRTGAPHYHWRGLVSRSCSGWEGVVPRRYGRKAKASGAGVAQGCAHRLADWKV